MKKQYDDGQKAKLRLVEQAVDGALQEVEAIVKRLYIKILTAEGYVFEQDPEMKKIRRLHRELGKLISKKEKE